MTDVFISYKRQERARCEFIAAKLRSLALDVWFDARLEAGHSFDREIEREVNAAKAVLVLWSPLAVDSDWVRNEATIGKRRGVLVAVQLESCDLPVNFVNTHCEHLPAREFADDDPAWRKVLERIGKLTGRPGLADYASATAAWRRAYPTDPLAQPPARVVAPPAPAPAPRPRPALVGGAALVGLALGAAAAVALRPGAPDPSAAAVAGDLVGVWRFPGGTCEAPLELGLGPDGLGFGAERAPIVGLTADGAVTTRGGITYQRVGAELQVGDGTGEPQAFVRCP